MFSFHCNCTCFILMLRGKVLTNSIIVVSCTANIMETSNEDQTVLIMPRDDREKTDDEPEEPEDHLKKISEYKTFALGLMDIALLSSNANQLRESLELCGPFRPLMITLLTISIVLQ